LTAQIAVFVPIPLYEEAVAWFLKNKGTLDILVHPNSGCGIQDHLNHALWGGRRWEIDPSIFFD
jgi:aromatic ring-cleaving dioxygenase